jgi:hypothetical protein
VIEENTAAFLADFGVPASLLSAAGTWNFADATMNWANAAFTMSGTANPVLYQGTVIFDQPDSSLLGNRAISTEYQITFRTGDFPPLTQGMEITVNGTVYEVIDSMKISDGVFSRAMLEL